MPSPAQAGGVGDNPSWPGVTFQAEDDGDRRREDRGRQPRVQ